MTGQLFRSLAIIVVIAVGTGRGDEEPEALGYPPFFGIIGAANGHGFIEYRFYTTAAVDDGQNATKHVMTETVARADIAEDKERNPMSNVRVLDLDGRRVKKADAVKRLKEGTPVVICTDGASVSKFYREHLRPDILILSRPAERTMVLTPR